MVSVESVKKGGMYQAEKLLKSFLWRSSRRTPTTFSNIRVSLLALRVKSYLHQMSMDAIVAAYTDCLGIDLNNMVKEFSIKLIANDMFYLTVNGRGRAKTRCRGSEFLWGPPAASSSRTG